MISSGVTNMAFAMVACLWNERWNSATFRIMTPAILTVVFGFNKKYSESTSQRIDETIRAVIDECYQRTKKRCSLNTKGGGERKLEQMAKTLLGERDSHYGADLIDMLGERPHGNYPISKEDVEKIRVNPTDRN